MDFPGSFIQHKSTISILGSEGIGPSSFLAGNLAAPSSQAWPTANQAFYLPFKLSTPYLVQKVWWLNGTVAAGSVDVGLYTLGGARILSAGSTVAAGTSGLQSVTLGTAVLVQPGSYYIVVSASLTTSTFWGWSPAIRLAQLVGMAQQATALPLPDPATLAALSGTIVLPIVGLSNAAVL